MISLVLSRPVLRASRGVMEPEVVGRGGTVLDRDPLVRSGDAGIARDCSCLRSARTGCASNSTGPSVLIGSFGRGLSTDMALDR